MTDIRKASLVLKTTDLTTNVTNTLNGTIFSSQYGSFNNKLSSFTWNNINLRTLLGDMYDMFDEFNLCLNTISTAQCSSIDTISDNKNVYIKLSGLPWLNQTYNVKTINNGNTTNIATFNFTAENAATQYYYSNNIATFGKSQDSCNMTIEYSRILDDTIPLPTLTITGLLVTGTSGTNTVTYSGTATGGTLAVGMVIVANNGIIPSFPYNTFITNINISTTTITLSNNLIASPSGLAATISGTYPNAIFIFDIFGIPKNDDNKNGDRLPIKSFIPAC
jgi:hypothetical protein